MSSVSFAADYALFGASNGSIYVHEFPFHSTTCKVSDVQRREDDRADDRDRDSPAQSMGASYVDTAVVPVEPGGEPPFAAYSGPVVVKGLDRERIERRCRDGNTADADTNTNACTGACTDACTGGDAAGVATSAPCLFAATWLDGRICLCRVAVKRAITSKGETRCRPQWTVLKSFHTEFSLCDVTFAAVRGAMYVEGAAGKDGSGDGSEGVEGLDLSTIVTETSITESERETVVVTGTDTRTETETATNLPQQTETETETETEIQRASLSSAHTVLPSGSSSPCGSTTIMLVAVAHSGHMLLVSLLPSELATDIGIDTRTSKERERERDRDMSSRGSEEEEEKEEERRRRVLCFDSNHRCARGRPTFHTSACSRPSRSWQGSAALKGFTIGALCSDIV